MTREQVEKRVLHILEVRADDEMAHSAEDDLYRELLKSIADDTCEHPQACAMLAITSQNIDFCRWMA